MTHKKATKHIFVTQKYARHESCVEISRVSSRYITKQISRVLCCFKVEAVTFQNTKGFSCDDVDEITLLTIVREINTNCKTCVGNFQAGYRQHA